MNLILTLFLLLTTSAGSALSNNSEYEHWISTFKAIPPDNNIYYYTPMPMNYKSEEIIKLLMKENDALKRKLKVYESTSTIHIFSWPEFCEKYGHCYVEISKGSNIHNPYLNDSDHLHGKGVGLSVISNYWDEMCNHCTKRRRKKIETKWVKEE